VVKGNQIIVRIYYYYYYYTMQKGKNGGWVGVVGRGFSEGIGVTGGGQLI